MERTSTSVYLIKPEGMSFRRALRYEIEAARLTIVRSRIGFLSATDVELMYPNTKPEKLAIIVPHLTQHPIEMGLVNGPFAKRELLRLCGFSNNPAKCEPTSLRARFGLSARTIGEVTLYLNCIHRSRNFEEVQRDSTIYQRIIPRRRLIAATT